MKARKKYMNTVNTFPQLQTCFAFALSADCTEGSCSPNF